VPDNLADWRDIIIIAGGGLMIVLFVLLIVFTLVLGTASRALLSTIQTMLRTEVSPLLESARQTVQNVQGTTVFVSQNAVRPIIRVYGIIAAFRRAFAVLMGFVRRTGRKRG
jgi:hypothetical protein